MDDFAELLERVLRKEREVAPRQALALDDVFRTLGDARSIHVRNRWQAVRMWT